MTGQPSPARRGPTLRRLIGRGWIPVVIVSVFAVAAVAGSRFHGMAGETEHPNAFIDSSRPVIPKDVVYEVFGPTGTTGQVNYLDENSQPLRAEFTTLPWTFTISTKLTSVFAHVVAQGDSDSIGCRITVNGAVRDEKTADYHHAQVYCLVKSA